MSDLISREDALNCFPLLMQGELLSIETVRHQLRKLPTVEAVPLSAIEKIKAEIIQYFMQNKDSEDLFLAGCGDGAYHALAIIDKAVKGD